MVTEMTDLERIKELVSILNKAGKSYYSEGVEIMSNFEYDKLYDRAVCPGGKTGSSCQEALPSRLVIRSLASSKRDSRRANAVS